MEDLIEYFIEELEILPENFSGNGELDMVVRKWCIDLPVEEISPLKETWKLVI
jgi:hypothetical protein